MTAIRASGRNRNAIAVVCSSALASLRAPAPAESDPAEPRGTIEISAISPVSPPPPLPRSVSSYDISDLQRRYTDWRNATPAVGIKNRFDGDQPFTNQPFSRQVGYDPSYPPPRGRTFYASVTYAFK